MKPDTKSTFYLSRIGIPYMIVAFIIVIPWLVFLAYALIHSIVCQDPQLDAMVILFFFYFIPFTYILYYLLITFFVKVTMTQEGILLTCGILMKPIEYKWEEVVSCGLDFMRIRHKAYKKIYFSKKYFPMPSYQTENYRHGANREVREFYKENHVYWSIKKSYKIYCAFEIREKDLAVIKTYLPENLLSQIEACEDKLNGI